MGPTRLDLVAMLGQRLKGGVVLRGNDPDVALLSHGVGRGHQVDLIAIPVQPHGSARDAGWRRDRFEPEQAVERDAAFELWRANPPRDMVDHRDRSTQFARKALDELWESLCLRGRMGGTRGHDEH